MTNVHSIEADYLNWPLYGLDKESKRSSMMSVLNELARMHRAGCNEYDRLLHARGHSGESSFLALEDYPFLPVRLFKEFELRSIPEKDVFKVLTSSGTSGQNVSRIVLDRETAQAQTKALIKILQNFLGKERLPMMIIDHPGVMKDRRSFSARAAGIMGFSGFGFDHTYALYDDGMGLNVDAVVQFAERHKGKRILMFGFTFMVWQFFVKELERLRINVDFSQAILIHGGGWKKLLSESVSNEAFKRTLADLIGIKSVHNYYGMVEQVGSIFMECEEGRLHAPAFADIIFRNPKNWSPLGVGEWGLAQVISLVPRSYPGNSLLTEDVGCLLGEDDCPCGRKGKTFAIKGRLSRAEVRGCSDTYEAAS